MQGLKRGLTHYGDAEFSLFLRKAFVKAMGYSRRRLLDGRSSASPTPSAATTRATATCRS